MSHLTLNTAGESHGPAEVCLLAGIPAGLSLSTKQVNMDLKRRQQGYGRGGRMAIEADQVIFLAGVRLGRTLGTPIAMMVENKDHINWLSQMSPDLQTASSDPSEPSHKKTAVTTTKKSTNKPAHSITIPRPGHADLPGAMKYGFADMRNVLERASARETVARVAAGSICKALLAEVGVEIKGRVVAIGEVAAPTSNYIYSDSVNWAAVEASSVSCDDAETSQAMCVAIDEARKNGESLGGVFEVWCWGVCPGLGGYATYEERLDGRLMGALGSIPAIKGVEFGEAFANAKQLGSKVHDPMCLATYSEEGEAARSNMLGNSVDNFYISRDSNRAAGLEGGMTNGMPIVVRAAMKPIPTLTTPLPSVDIGTMVNTVAHVERSDVTAVPAACVVGEAVVAFVVASAYLEKFAGDSLEQFKVAVGTYERELELRGLWHRQ